MIATVKSNKLENRFELWIEGRLKAYTTKMDYKQELIDLAESKGYSVSEK